MEVSVLYSMLQERSHNAENILKEKWKRVIYALDDYPIYLLWEVFCLFLFILSGYSPLT